jgi:hypothetical protein
MTPDQIIEGLNQKFFVAQVQDEGGSTSYTRILWRGIDGVFSCETFRDFRKRFPIKQLINGKLWNVGNFWLHHPRRRQVEETFYRVTQIKKEK